MAPQEISKLLKREPFLPLKVFLTDGAVYEIQSPSDAWLTALTLHVGFDVDENGLFQNTVYISPNHVSRIVPIVGSKA